MMTTLYYCHSLKRPVTSAAAGLSCVLGKIGKKPKISVLVKFLCLILISYSYYVVCAKTNCEHILLQQE